MPSTDEVDLAETPRYRRKKAIEDQVIELCDLLIDGAQTSLQHEPDYSVHLSDSDRRIISLALSLPSLILTQHIEDSQLDDKLRRYRTSEYIFNLQRERLLVQQAQRRSEFRARQEIELEEDTDRVRRLPSTTDTLEPRPSQNSTYSPTSPTEEHSLANTSLPYSPDTTVYSRASDSTFSTASLTAGSQTTDLRTQPSVLSTPVENYSEVNSTVSTASHIENLASAFHVEVLVEDLPTNQEALLPEVPDFYYQPITYQEGDRVSILTDNNGLEGEVGAVTKVTIQQLHITLDRFPSETVIKFKFNVLKES